MKHPTRSVNDEPNTQADALKPCPFCGSTNVDVCAATDGHNPPLVVWCDDCWSRGSPGATDADAMRRWNRRVTP